MKSNCRNGRAISNSDSQNRQLFIFYFVEMRRQKRELVDPQFLRSTTDSTKDKGRSQLSNISIPWCEK
jgi:hypothetical protein